MNQTKNIQYGKFQDQKEIIDISLDFILSNKYEYVTVADMLYNLPLMVIFFVFYSIKLNSNESIQYYLPE